MAFVHSTKDTVRKCGRSHKDPTADSAILKVDLERIEEEDRFYNLLDTIKYISDLAGFDIENRIVFKDRKTGKIWR